MAGKSDFSTCKFITLHHTEERFPWLSRQEIVYKKVKVRCTFVQALRLCTGRTDYRESRGIALHFHDHGTRMCGESASRPGRSLSPRKARYPLYRRLGGPQGRSGQVRKISPPPGFDSRTDHPVASRYTDWAIPAHIIYKVNDLLLQIF